jgi:hypothetical protein
MRHNEQDINVSLIAVLTDYQFSQSNSKKPAGFTQAGHFSGAALPV